MTVKELIAKFEYAANNPNALLDEYLKEGKKVIGEVLLPLPYPS